MLKSYRVLALSAALCAGAAATLAYARVLPAGANPPPSVMGTDPAALSDELVSTQAPKRVTVRFDAVPVAKVLSWLADHDANFAIASTGIRGDLKLSMNVRNRPISAVENAVAAALGGAWVSRDGILVFEKGGEKLRVWGHPGEAVPSGEPRAERVIGRLGGAAALPEIGAMPAGAGTRTITLDGGGPAGDGRSETLTVTVDGDGTPKIVARPAPREGAAAIERDGMPNVLELRRSIQSALGQAVPGELKLRELQGSLGSIAPDSAQLAQALQAAERALEAAKADQRGQVRTELQRAIEELKGARSQGVTVRAFAGGRAVQAERAAAIAGATRAQVRVAAGGSAGRTVGMTLGSDGIQRLFDSLSAAQQASMAKRGYLTLGELTSEQLALIGNPKGEFELSIRAGGRSIRIKSK